VQRLRVLFAIVLALSLTQMAVGQGPAYAADLNLLDDEESVIEDVAPAVDVDLDADVDLDSTDDETEETVDTEVEATVDETIETDADADVTVEESVQSEGAADEENPAIDVVEETNDLPVETDADVCVTVNAPECDGETGNDGNGSGGSGSDAGDDDCLLGLNLVCGDGSAGDGIDVDADICLDIEGLVQTDGACAEDGDGDGDGNGSGGNGTGSGGEGPFDDGTDGLPSTQADVEQMPNTGTGSLGSQSGNNPSGFTLLAALLLLVLTGARALNPILGSRIR
jgi:hypothetical protein